MTKIDNLKKLISKVNNQVGDNALKLGSELVPYDLLDTPWTTLNTLCQGFPRGRFTTIAGPQQVGKTTLMLQMIAYHQQQDPDFVCLWSETENSLDPSWMSRLGIDLSRVVIQEYDTSTETMERLLQGGINLIRDSRAVDLWVINSIGGLVPQDEQKKNLEEGTMLKLQTGLSRFYPKCSMAIMPRDSFPGTAVVMIGHIYNAPTTTGYTLEEVKGGNAVKHWAHLRLMMHRGPKSDWPDKQKVLMPDGKERLVYPGWSGRIALEKTRQNENEGQQILLNFKLGQGFDSSASTVHAALAMGVITRNGPMYCHELFPNGKVKGRDAVFDFFRADAEAFQKLSKQVTDEHLTQEATTT